jgi:hypothetical protein
MNVVTEAENRLANFVPCPKSILSGATVSTGSAEFFPIRGTETRVWHIPGALVATFVAVGAAQSANALDGA